MCDLSCANILYIRVISCMDRDAGCCVGVSLSCVARLSIGGLAIQLKCWLAHLRRVYILLKHLISFENCTSHSIIIINNQQYLREIR